MGLTSDELPPLPESLPTAEESGSLGVPEIWMPPSSLNSIFHGGPAGTPGLSMNPSYQNSVIHPGGPVGNPGPSTNPSYGNMASTHHGGPAGTPGPSMNSSYLNPLTHPGVQVGNPLPGASMYPSSSQNYHGASIGGSLNHTIGNTGDLPHCPNTSNSTVMRGRLSAIDKRARKRKSDQDYRERQKDKKAGMMNKILRLEQENASLKQTNDSLTQSNKNLVDKANNLKSDLSKVRQENASLKRSWKIQQDQTKELQGKVLRPPDNVVPEAQRFTGDKAWAPSSGILPTDFIEHDYNVTREEIEEENAMDFVQQVGFDENNETPEIQYEPSQNVQQKRKSTEAGPSHVKTRKKKSTGGAAKLPMQIDKQCSTAVCMNEETSRLNPDTDPFGIPQAVKILEELSEDIPEASKLYFFALKLIVNKEKRTMFLTIRQRVRVRWLQEEMKDSLKCSSLLGS